jgi:hypothetical protein
MTSDAPDEPRVSRITLEIAENGQITPKIEGVPPYAVPTILRKVAATIEAELTRV